jgi:peptide-methionine (S)-S-oxide reductase
MRLTRRWQKRLLVSGSTGLIVLAGVMLWAAGAPPTVEADNPKGERVSDKTKLEKATFGNGCFWCTEAIFKQIDGVVSVVSGYSGGHVKDPTYQAVCAGQTGHAEVIQIAYDPEVATYEHLLEVFWKTHDPTTLNRQGNDVGTQYRSAIFYHGPQQKELAERFKKKLDASGAFDAPIVTRIEPLTEFYPAEDYHQNYYELNRNQPYCMVVIRPKLEKYKRVFQDQPKVGDRH